MQAAASFRRGPTDDIWDADFLRRRRVAPRNGRSASAPRDWDEACRGRAGQVRHRHHRSAAPPAPTRSPSHRNLRSHPFNVYAERAIAKLRQQADAADAQVPGKGHNFRALARRIENDLLPRWGATTITS